jgi:hypothetical protein
MFIPMRSKFARRFSWSKHFGGMISDFGVLFSGFDGVLLSDFGVMLVDL